MKNQSYAEIETPDEKAKFLIPVLADEEYLKVLQIQNESEALGLQLSVHLLRSKIQEQDKERFLDLELEDVIDLFNDWVKKSEI